MPYLLYENKHHCNKKQHRAVWSELGKDVGHAI